MFCSRCGTWSPEAAAACPACGAALHAQNPPAPAPVATPAQASFPAAATGLRPPRSAYWPRHAFGGFWRRFAASFVDGLLLYFPQAIAKVALGIPLIGAVPDERTGQDLMLSVAMIGVYWSYTALLESSARQATLGQQVMGLRVTDLEGRRISFLRATGRYFAQFLSAIICGVGYLFNLWTSRRQTLHDLVAGCVLVRPELLPEVAPARAGEPA